MSPSVPEVAPRPIHGLRDQDEGERVGEDQRDIEQLEIDLDLKADAVAPAEQLDHQDDLPDQRQAGARRGEDIRRELRQDHVTQRTPARHAETLRHFGERGIERAGALAQVTTVFGSLFSATAAIAAISFRPNHT